MKTCAHDPREVVHELAKLRAIFPEATRVFLNHLAFTIWKLEATGATHFGGPEVFAWWLVQRCQPKPPLTKARIKKLVKMAGRSQKSLDLLVAVAEERSKARRLSRGWTFLELCSYMTNLYTERVGGYGW